MLQKALLCRLKGENKSVGTKELPQGTQSLSFLGGGVEEGQSWRVVPRSLKLVSSPRELRLREEPGVCTAGQDFLTKCPGVQGGAGRSHAAWLRSRFSFLHN